MANRRKRIQIEARRHRDYIDRLANELNNSLSKTCELLIAEAIAARQDRSAHFIGDLEHALPAYSISSLGKAIELILRELMRRIVLRNSTTPVRECEHPACPFCRTWQIDRLANASTIPVERIEAIANGDTPCPQELVGLFSAGLDPEKVKQFQDHHKAKSEKQEIENGETV